MRGGERPSNPSAGYLDRESQLQRYGMNEDVAPPAAATERVEFLFGTEGYIDRSRYSDIGGGGGNSGKADEDDIRTICIWPRQVVGGLFSLVRFAREMQRRLIQMADRGEIPNLLPDRRSA